MKKISIDNRKAKYDYEILETCIAGIELCGSEVKSLRSGKGSIVESFCQFINNELFIINSYIPIYDKSTRFHIYGERDNRKLLLNRSELSKLKKSVEQKGMTIIPLSIFLNEQHRFKVKIGLCRGKHNYDKRETIKKRDAERSINNLKYDR
jgi:SsrA-binding protein